MAKYLLAYHGGAMPDSEAERGKVMQAWEAWFGQLGPALKDPGNPVGDRRFVGGKGADDGASDLSGYTIIEAGSLDEAAKLAEKCPVILGGATVEVCETFDVM